MTERIETITILCVEDNSHVAEALRVALGRVGGFDWGGWLPSADDMADVAAAKQPDIVLLDVDMPGRDPFDATRELATRAPDVRVVVFTGHVQEHLIDQALDAGAWGYAAKNDGESELFDVIRRVVDGEVAFSSEANAVYGRG